MSSLGPDFTVSYRPIWLACVPVAFLAGLPASISAAEGADSEAGSSPSNESFAIHGQATYVEQETDAFNAPYSGPNSLSPSSGRETVDATLSLGARLWSGGEAWATPEIDQGHGLDDTLGVAGFTSGEAYKVGANAPYFRLPRVFVRQTVSTGGETESVQSVANQLGGARGTDRWVLTIGKFAVTDVFDTNRYAHDPRADFLNWAAIDTGTYDYAADAWGYTDGFALERYLGSWVLRGGVFDLSDIPNSESLEHGFHEFQMDAEIERAYDLLDQTGRVRLTGYDTRGRMALLSEAIALAEATDTAPAVAPIRQYRSRLGASLNVEQPITSNLGVFARIGKSAGNVEPYEFSDIDRAIAVGASLNGGEWRRPLDTVGLVGIDNEISALREEYLALGGLGILVGDGKLPHPGPEQIVETYYSCGLLTHLAVTLDYQWIRDPGYNSDRGPVSVYAVRVHAQF
jgi:high affinity Mn2+ porin